MSQGWQVCVCVCVYCAKLRASLASLQVVIVFFGGSPVTPRVGGGGCHTIPDPLRKYLSGSGNYPLILVAVEIPQMRGVLVRKLCVDDIV